MIVFERLAARVGGRSMLVSLIVAIAFFMETLDSTIIVTAIPRMAGDFGVDPARMSLGITAYIMAAAACVTASGWLADRIGTRTLFSGAIVLFAVASLACGLAPNFNAFVTARAVQGVAAAMMSPVGRLVVLRTSEKKDLMKALSALIWPGLIAPVIGPPLGGWITQTASWHWIFFVNVPIAVIGLPLILATVPQEKQPTKPFDTAGFLLTALALVCLTYGFDLLALRDKTALVEGVGLMAASVVVGSLALAHMRRSDRPLIRLDALKVKSFFVASVSGGVVSRATIGAVPFLLPLMLQIAHHLSATEAGGMLMIYMAANLGMKTVTNRIITRLGIRTTLIGSSLVAGGTIALCALIGPSLPLAVNAAILAAAGALRSLQFTAVTMVNFADIAPPQRQPASVLSSLTQQIGFGAGVAVGALLLTVSQWTRGAASIGLVDFQAALGIAGLAAAAASLSYRGLARTVGDEIAGRAPRPQA
jgi:EmrB/QacA subfamily drug resistance transporter